MNYIIKAEALITQLKQLAELPLPESLYRQLHSFQLLETEEPALDEPRNKLRR